MLCASLVMGGAGCGSPNTSRDDEGPTDEAPASGTYDVLMEKNVTAEMRDGVVLRADVYRPDAEGVFPALLQRTPYSKYASTSPETFRRIASHGYVVVVQDTRGRYASEGVAIPHDESEDGYDTVEWVAGLPGVDGRVGMWGGSYLATTQLMAASLAPPHLKAIAPSSSYTSRYDMVFQGGAFYLSDGLSWNLGQAADVRRRRGGATFEERDGPVGLTDDERTRLRDEWLWHLPLASIEALDIRELAPGYFWMLEHPSYDDFWVTYDIGRRHDRFEVPALHTTGWYDTLLKGTLENFRGIRARASSPAARDGQRLIVGPWTHSRPTPRSTNIDGVEYGPQAGFEYERLLLDWYDHWLKGAENGVMDGAPVRLFVMGINAWRDEMEWPLSRAVPTPFYLHSDGTAASSMESGRLDMLRPGSEPGDSYLYDPNDPVPTGAMSGYSRSPADPTSIESRPDVAVYTSEPLTEPLEVTGYVELVLVASSSAPDTDFTGKLIDVGPDGTARTLTDGILRARYRDSATRPELLTPGQPAELRIDLLATSNVFLPGHRIRIEISSSNFPRFDRNPNTGERFGTGAAVSPARQTIHHDADRASYVLLPVIPGS
jgi:putative CocE/NonD family hydrolase